MILDCPWKRKDASSHSEKGRCGPLPLHSRRVSPKNQGSLGLETKHPQPIRLLGSRHRHHDIYDSSQSVFLLKCNWDSRANFKKYSIRTRPFRQKKPLLDSSPGKVKGIRPKSSSASLSRGSSASVHFSNVLFHISWNR